MNLIFHCDICGKSGSQECGGCRCIRYCSRDHQKLGWKSGHKEECRKIVYSSTGVLVAAKNVLQGSTILREQPVIVGPRVNSRPLCLGCLQILETVTEKCSACQWPLCSVGCMKWHKDECALMSIEKYRNTSNFIPKKESSEYSLILPLRFFALKENPRNFGLDVNCVLPKEYKKDKTDNLMPFLKMIGFELSQDDVFEGCLLMDRFCYFIPNNDGDLRGFYPRAAMAKHDCLPNAKYYIKNNSFNLVLVATVDIPEGEEITVSRTDPLLPTAQRREELMKQRFIECNCTRCADPTEKGTHLSSIKCSSCRTGMVKSTNPLDPSAPYSCINCQQKLSAKQIRLGNLSLSKNIRAINKTNHKALEMFLNSNLASDGILHPRNYHIVRVKYLLIELYGSLEMGDLTEDEIFNRLSLLEDLLELSRILSPGYTKLRCLLLYYYQAAKLQYTRFMFDGGRMYKSQVDETMKELSDILREATLILSTEPELHPIIEAQLSNISRLFED